ncbi:hypothetical protein [Paraburkholderia phosphatilytica]|uniref:hypothetical protein n=1 Tax=Paraburkholderia phosphatilytica TaxID=2282883 RepID=UPI000E50A155|nr:hypothetical protein [Paraburkholderia phosphatilytica]
MKRRLLTFIRVLFFIATTYFGGFLLSHLIADCIPEMPDWMCEAIRFTLDRTGNEDIRDPENITTSGLLTITVASWMSVGAALWFATKMLRRRRANRRRDALTNNSN